MSKKHSPNKKPTKQNNKDEEPIFVIEFYKEGYHILRNEKTPEDFCLSCLLTCVLEDLENLENAEYDDSDEISFNE